MPVPRHDPYVEPARAEALRRAQGSVPEGARILAQLYGAGGLDFRRNHIYIFDSPAEVSPPPGMPRSEGPGALADYFRRVGLRYVLVDLAKLERDRVDNPARAEEYRDAVPWLAAQLRLRQDIEHDFRELRRRSRKLHDDGTFAVYDLDAPAAAPPPA